ncbi:hypothetical protein niasHS_017607 [Heterodera schachtii]|uniref:Uncharacterized protein n=1 Tax=Heterodera schachtii TaxID=97005 RepID=A0ABD2IH81_HETSC
MECVRHLLHLLLLLTFSGQLLVTLADLYDDYEQCKSSGHFGAEDGSPSLVCDSEGRLTPQALAQLNGILTDMGRDAGCQCADGCDGKPFSVRLLVTSGERVEQSGGTTALNETAGRIWDSEGMGTEQCDNGMLMLYIRDQKRMVTFQGHRRLQIYSDRDIDNLHELTSRTNRSGAAEALISLNSDAEAQQKAEDEQNTAPIVGLSVALALTFFTLFCLLCVLAVKCCSIYCCQQKRKRNKAKYYLDPALMANYKSIEPIYIVTPNANSGGFSGAAAFAPQSGTSLYGTATFPRHAGRSFSPPPPGMLFGRPPPPPHGVPFHAPPPRSATPTSTQRSRRTQNASGGGGVQSMHNTPEQNKRDKIDRTMTVRSNATYYTATNANPSPENLLVATKKPFSHPQHPSTSTNRESGDTPSPQNRNSFPFLDPKRKQEIQTREEFIG